MGKITINLRDELMSADGGWSQFITNKQRASFMKDNKLQTNSKKSIEKKLHQQGYTGLQWLGKGANRTLSMMEPDGDPVDPAKFDGRLAPKYEFQKQMDILLKDYVARTAEKGRIGELLQTSKYWTQYVGLRPFKTYPSDQLKKVAKRYVTVKISQQIISKFQRNLDQSLGSEFAKSARRLSYLFLIQTVYRAKLLPDDKFPDGYTVTVRDDEAKRFKQVIDSIHSTYKARLKQETSSSIQAKIYAERDLIESKFLGEHGYSTFYPSYMLEMREVTKRDYKTWILADSEREALKESMLAGFREYLESAAIKHECDYDGFSLDDHLDYGEASFTSNQSAHWYLVGMREWWSLTSDMLNVVGFGNPVLTDEEHDAALKKVKYRKPLPIASVDYDWSPSEEDWEIEEQKC